MSAFLLAIWYVTLSSFCHSFELNKFNFKQTVYSDQNQKPSIKRDRVKIVILLKGLLLKLNERILDAFLGRQNKNKQKTKTKQNKKSKLQKQKPKNGKCMKILLSLYSYLYCGYKLYTIRSHIRTSAFNRISTSSFHDWLWEASFGSNYRLHFSYSHLQRPFSHTLLC